MANSVLPKIFYGSQEYFLNLDKKVSSMVKKQIPLQGQTSRSIYDLIDGPNKSYKKFNKQNDALEAAAKYATIADPLSTFVYQNDSGYRKFVVAHPATYWEEHKNLPPEQRCSYEVIPENEPCRLYLDLEFSKELNPNHNGPRMTKIITDIFCKYLEKFYDNESKTMKTLCLDSTNTEKFSRHVIFVSNTIAFKDNISAGVLVKSVCMDITEYLNSNKTKQKILKYFDKEDIESLMVQTKKGKQLFIDTGVYTRNRHFRIYKSTKWGKSSNLELAADYTYIPLTKQYRDRDLKIFLDSLVSYFPNKEKLHLIDFDNDDSFWNHKKIPYHNVLQQRQIVDMTIKKTSEFPELDKYILGIINPGKIRQVIYFDVSRILVYEIVGYRYCENIGRWHKSNNIYLIVDLNKNIMYQKCHDTEDCAGFKSQSKKLPEEVSFYLDQDMDIAIMEQIAVEWDDHSPKDSGVENNIQSIPTTLSH